LGYASTSDFIALLLGSPARGDSRGDNGRRLWSEATAFPIGNGFTPIPPIPPLWGGMRGGIRECSEAGGKRMSTKFFYFIA